MAIFILDDFQPIFDSSVWIAESAELIGKIILKENSSVWPKCVIRGDGEEYIEIGAGTNIQDNSVLHYDLNFPLIIGENVTVGHQCLLHGCKIGNNSLIGMGATILNGAKIGKNSMVGARSLITENKTFPDGVLIKGSPAKVARELTADEIAYIATIATHYQQNAARFKRGLKQISTVNPK